MPVKWTTEFRRALRQQRVRDGICVDCGGAMLPEWPKRVYCPSCAEVRRVRQYNYQHTARGRRASRERIRRRRQDPAVRERMNAKMRELKQAKVLRHECWSCPERSLDDSVFCALHRDKTNAARRDLYARRKRGEDTSKTKRKRKRATGRTPRVKLVERTVEIVSSTPIDDYRTGDLDLREAAVRYAELCNGITTRDIGDAFGADHLERDIITHAVHNAIKSGRLYVAGYDSSHSKATRGDRLIAPARTRKAA